MSNSRSRRLSEEDLSKAPRHCLDSFDKPDQDGLGRTVREFRETYPLGLFLGTDLRWGWEPAVFKIVIASENQLINEAEEIRDEAIEVFKEHRKYDNRNPVNLGISLRIRKDTFGPRLNWVRFIGKVSERSGKKRYFTEPIKLAGKYRTSSRIFKSFPADIREQLMELEERAAWVRFQTEKLNRLRLLCFESQSPPS